MIGILLKAGIAALGTIFTYLTGNFTPLIFLLIFFEAGDYITGMYCAWNSGTLSSKVALKGFLKKMLYFFLVSVAFGFDFMIFETIQLVGASFSYPAMFGILAVCYLLSTEMISIVENLDKVGISVPFLAKGLQTFQEKIKYMGEKKDGKH